MTHILSTIDTKSVLIIRVDYTVHVHSDMLVARHANSNIKGARLYLLPNRTTQQTLEDVSGRLPEQLIRYGRRPNGLRKTGTLFNWMHSIIN